MPWCWLLALCLSFAGCYSENNTWAAKLGDDTMPIGGYIYYLSTAYNEAAMKISSDIEVLDGEVDGQPAQEWIENRALDYLYGSYYLETKLQELGQELTEDEEAQADSITNSTWAYYQTAFENMGHLPGFLPPGLLRVQHPVPEADEAAVR